jgi:hypothetical protein
LTSVVSGCGERLGNAWSTHLRCLQSQRFPGGGRAQVSSQSKVSRHVPGANGTTGAAGGGKTASGFRASAEFPPDGRLAGANSLVETVAGLAVEAHETVATASKRVGTANRVIEVFFRQRVERMGEAQGGPHASGMPAAARTGTRVFRANRAYRTRGRSPREANRHGLIAEFEWIAACQILWHCLCTSSTREG